MPEYWERYGFITNPFGFQFAEADDWTWENASQTFVEHPGFDEILDYTKSSVLLAKSGSGKTALRRYFEGSLRNPYSQLLKKPAKPLIVNFVDFTHPILLADQPNILLENVITVLFDYIADSLVAEGIVLQDARLATALTDSKTPLRKLQAVEAIVAEFGYDCIYILVDHLDDLSIDIQEQFASTLWMTNSLFTLKNIIWKFFVTDLLHSILLEARSYKTGRLEPAIIVWDVGSLTELLDLRIKWASNGLINSADQLFEPAFLDELVLTDEGTPFDQLVQMALEHQRYGPPRALMILGDMLLRLSSGTHEQLTEKNWYEFRKASESARVDSYSPIDQDETKSKEIDTENNLASIEYQFHDSSGMQGNDRTGYLAAVTDMLAQLWRESRGEIVGGLVVAAILGLLAWLFGVFGSLNELYIIVCGKQIKLWLVVLLTGLIFVLILVLVFGIVRICNRKN